jgi:diadenosine tetraphosphatase ApaH/serine/threonine PP2A family protein phosphatase
MSDDPFQPDPADDIQPHIVKPLHITPAPAKSAAPALGPGPTAIISDIHGNLEALNAVLADIDKRAVQRIVCLGDVVGYGPNPLECIDLVIDRCDFSLMGNHDFAIFFEPHNFNTAAENAAFWTRAQFENDPDRERRNRRWQYLGSMPTRMGNDRFVCFHASPRRPINEYVFPDDVYNAPQKISALFDRIDKACFLGHTHVPGVFLADPDFYSPEEIHYRHQITDELVMVNVGSVGQPRDKNPDSSYAILHPPSDADPKGAIEFIRLPYDVHTTVSKIKAIDALDNFLGTRLLDGR